MGKEGYCVFVTLQPNFVKSFRSDSILNKVRNSHILLSISSSSAFKSSKASSDPCSDVFNFSSCTKTVCEFEHEEFQFIYIFLN